MNESDINTLKEIANFCDTIERRIQEFSINEESFVSNDAYQDMLLMPLMQIGELANTLSDEAKNSISQIPWYDIIAFRNIIAHDYGIVDPLWAWNTISLDVPELKSVIMNLGQW